MPCGRRARRRARAWSSDAVVEEADDRRDRPSADGRWRGRRRRPATARRTSRSVRIGLGPHGIRWVSGGTCRHGHRWRASRGRSGAGRVTSVRRPAAGRGAGPAWRRRWPSRPWPARRRGRRCRPTAVTQAAANSGWWLTAPPASMARSGWMVGTASDTLAMSVERVGRGAPSSSRREPAAEGLGVGPVGGEQVGVALHVGVVGARGRRTRRAAPVARAPASKQARTRGSSAARPSRVSDRAMNRPVTRGRDDVGGLAPVGDHAVDLVARAAAAGAAGRGPPGRRPWRPRR